MPQTRSTKVQTPINSDTFNLTGDLATMAESIPALIPVANDAEGDTIATARAAAGFAVNDARPLTVYNNATKTIRVKDSGAGWRDLDFPLGPISQTFITASSGSIGTTLTVVKNITPVTFIVGRRYEIKWYYEYSGSTAGNYAEFAIHTCSTADGAAVTTGLTKIGNASKRIGAASTGENGVCEAWYIPGSTGDLQLKFTAQIWSGAGTTIVQASASTPVRYTVIYWGGIL